MAIRAMRILFPLKKIFITGLLLFSNIFASTLRNTPDIEAQLTNLETINTPYVEYTPFILRDESALYFESNRPGGVGLTGDFDIWYSKRDTASPSMPFLPPVNLGKPVNTVSFDGLPSLRKLPNGDLELYFTSFASRGRPGPAETNIYYSINKGNGFSEPIPVQEINTNFHDRMPSVSADGKYLFFSSNRPGGYGKDDIYFSKFNEKLNRWNKPENLGPRINSTNSEVSPSIHSDGITLYFSSNRKNGVGGYDIYVTQILPKNQANESIKWKTPENLGTPFNSPQDDEYPTVTRDGEFLYFSSNRAGGKGLFDIYRAKVPNFAKPQVIITMKGRVHELHSMKGIEAKISILAVEGERNLSSGLPDGNYSIDFLNNRKYKILVTAPGYENYETWLDFRKIHVPTTIDRNFPLNYKLLLPDKFTIEVQFRNTNGELLKPRTDYEINPEDRLPRLLPFFNNVGQIQVPAQSANIEQTTKYLKGQTLKLTANQEGYKPLQFEKPLHEVINLDKRPVEKTIRLMLTMLPVTEPEPKKPKPDDSKKTAIVELNKNGYAAVVYFKHNIADKIKPDDLSALKKIVEQYKSKPEQKVVVNGHTDSTGTRAVNIRKSKERALFVKKTLVEMGLPAKSIEPNWFANQRPAVEETNDKNRALNRRVEISFVLQGKQKNSQKKDSTKTNEKNNKKANGRPKAPPKKDNRQAPKSINQNTKDKMKEGEENRRQS